MNRLAVVCVLAVLALICFSCASSKNLASPSTFKISKITFAKGNNETEDFDVLLTPTDIFSTQDDKIVSHIEFANLTGSHELKWEWYDANGDLYMASKSHPIEAPDGKYIAKGTAWHTISLQGEKAELYPGIWNVKIFFDDEFMTSEKFIVEKSIQAFDRKGYAVFHLHGDANERAKLCILVLFGLLFNTTVNIERLVKLSGAAMLH